MLDCVDCIGAHYVAAIYVKSSTTSSDSVSATGSATTDLSTYDNLAAAWQNDANSTTPTDDTTAAAPGPTAEPARRPYRNPEFVGDTDMWFGSGLNVPIGGGKTVIPGTTNIQRGTSSYVWEAFFGVGGPTNLRKTKLEELGSPAVGSLPADFNRANLTTPQIGGHKYTNIPGGHYVGTAGAGPCIGVIVVSSPDENGNRTVWVFHFKSTEDPNATLNASGPFPDGSHGIFFGGDNTPESNGTLDSVLDYFEGTDRVTIDGYHDSSGMFVDRDGNYFNRIIDRN